MNDKELIDRAAEAQTRAYAPYSNFKVGAALLAKGGEVFTGCNVENGSLGLTVCAERVAILKAVEAGFRNFVKVAVFSDAPEPATPCGACRQVMWEFSPELQVLCANRIGQVRKYKLRELLSNAFDMPTQRR